MLKNEHAPRILISQPGDLCECLLTLPVVNAMRNSYPDAFIAWVGRSDAESLLDSHASIDELISVDVTNLKFAMGAIGLRRRLRALKIDIAIDAQGSSVSALVSRLSAARQRLGMDRPFAGRVAAKLNGELISTTSEHAIDKRLELLGPLGVLRPAVEFRIPVTPDASGTVAAFMQQAHLSNGFAVLHLGSNWSSMLWPPSSFRTVARFLHETLGLTTVASWTSAEEIEWIESIVAQSGGYILQAPPLDSLEMAELLRCSKLCVACDPYAIHLTAAVETPCVALDSEVDASFQSPYGSQHQTLSRHLGISRPSSSGVSVWRGISPQRVCAACEKLARSEDVHKEHAA